MKKITLLFILLLTASTWIYGQCTTSTGGQWPTATVTVFNNGSAETISNNNWPNAEYSNIQGLIVGNTYTVTGTNTSSVYITVAETTPAFDFGGTVITHGASTVSFTATTPEILIYWHLDVLCSTQTNVNTATTIQCTSASCTCTAIAAPNPATTPTPADGAIDVPIDFTDPANPLITPFSWVDATTGDPAESYNLSLGTTPTGDDIGTITGATNGNGITYSWATGTTYYWKVDAVNCAGTTPGTVWSFTTSACTSNAPDAVTTPTPADGAVDVPIDMTDPANPLITPFSWVDATTGDPATSFTLSLGATPTGDDIGTLDPATNGNGIIYTWAYSTTYYWYVTAINCGGSTASAVRSFTTEADPALTVAEFETNQFSVYPNPAKDEIGIKSNTPYDSVEIFNQLGQRVIQLDKDKLIDNIINIRDLNNGIYFMRITADDKEQTIKFIKE